jgi:hypothetical protein
VPLVLPERESPFLNSSKEDMIKPPLKKKQKKQSSEWSSFEENLFMTMEIANGKLLIAPVEKSVSCPKPRALTPPLHSQIALEKSL